MKLGGNSLPFFKSLPGEIQDIISSCRGVIVAESCAELLELAMRGEQNGLLEVSYDVPGKGRIVEAQVAKVRNGIAVNYPEPYMRKRDPDCMFIGDEEPTDQVRFTDRFKTGFAELREETFSWLKEQELVVFSFEVGKDSKSFSGFAVCPANAGFFALGLAMMQGILSLEEQGPEFVPSGFLFIAPPFRHSHFAGKQVVVHNRLEKRHELFSYNLYPGPSAKKGIYGMLLHQGEQAGWLTAHCSTVKVVTPYDNHVVFMHEGASGGGKSEMLQYPHRESDGRLLLGTNVLNGEKRFLSLPHGCALMPVTDDMGLCHRTVSGRERKMNMCDAERAWFVRVDHIDKYGTDPGLEALTVNPSEPLLFLNIDAVPGSRALIWEHSQDTPGKPCSNPRVIIPRNIVPGIVQGDVRLDIRSFGVRCPPCTRANPTYGILSLMHVLPPALAWLWRLTAPRGHNNPSIVNAGGGLSSEGVGSFWPFATGKRVEYANILLRQIMSTTDTLFLLIPNQHVGAWKVGFMPQWVSREYLARRGAAPFREDQISPARLPLLGYNLNGLNIEGTFVPPWFLKVETQADVGQEAYDQGAAMLNTFFKEQLKLYLTDDLLPMGKRIIESCLAGCSVEIYDSYSKNS